MSRRTRWQDLSPNRRRMIIAVGAADLGLRLVALVDVIKSPQSAIHGPKAMWIALLTAVNSAGVLPSAYLIWGRRRRHSDN